MRNEPRSNTYTTMTFLPYRGITLRDRDAGPLQSFNYQTSARTFAALRSTARLRLTLGLPLSRVKRMGLRHMRGGVYFLGVSSSGTIIAVTG